MGRPLASWPAQAAVWDKSWLESNFKIGAQRVNVLVSSMCCEQKGILICNNQAYTGGPLILCLQTGKVHYSEINTYYLVFASHNM